MANATTKEFDFGKDHVVLMTDADACVESRYQLPERDIDDNEPRGVVQPNGDFNWECPCLGGMATGPCGYEFREAFSCVQLSKEEPKGMECVDAFRAMQECMSKYPALYDRSNDDDDDDDDDVDEETAAAAAAAIAAKDAERASDLDAKTISDDHESLGLKIDQLEDKHKTSDTTSPATSPLSVK